MLQKRS